MIKKKIAFLDRDGTINVEKNYLYKIEDFEFLPSVIEGLKLLQDADYLLVIITNQSGVARGYYSLDDMYKLHNWMTEKLRDNGVYIEAIYYCPHHPNASVEMYKKDCDCRKPKTGLFWNAIDALKKSYDIDYENSVAIGDKCRDLEICQEIHCKGFLIGETNIKSEYTVVENIKEAALTLLRDI